ncbi:MAG: alpha-ketoglutarate-dependent dioxygenase AlkB [Sphingobacteriales bacterium]|nr:alpha-ketoglutarate-dependent dioxygenase AlkB [Sphingobacteriales bacterium]
MDLFNQEVLSNLLPHDGTVIYYGKVINQTAALTYFDVLFNKIEWKNDEAVIFGKHMITKRKVAWYGDKNYAYTYSNITKEALPWTTTLLELKQLAEKITETTYNSCLLNLYHDGDESMAWHSDDEKTLARHQSIASFSFGAERKFSFKHKTTQQKVSLILENGSLLEMKDETQENWWHRLPKTKLVKTPRINLTFRTIMT